MHVYAQFDIEAVVIVSNFEKLFNRHINNHSGSLLVKYQRNHVSNNKLNYDCKDEESILYSDKPLLLDSDVERHARANLEELKGMHTHTRWHIDLKFVSVYMWMYTYTMLPHIKIVPVAQEGRGHIC